LYAQPLCFRGKSGLGIAFTKPLPSRYSIYMNVVWHISMKVIVSILLTLIHLNLLGQPSEWNKDVIKKNKVKGVLVYTQVPKTNPDYFKEPKGLMLISETAFDKEGRVIQSNCKNCYIEEHKEGDCCADVIQKFFYKNEKLLRVEEMDFYKSTSLYAYDTLNNRRLVIRLDRKDERNKTKIEYFDIHGREISTIEIDFDDIWIEGDTVSQVFMSKTLTSYSQKTKTTEELGRGFGSKIERVKFETFKKSNDIDEIEKVFKSLDLSFLESRSKLTTHYDDRGREVKIVDENDGATLTTYTRAKNGLIKKEELVMPKFKFQYEYHYRFWN
jgi:hypothetical protein